MMIIHDLSHHEIIDEAMKGTRGRGRYSQLRHSVLPPRNRHCELRIEDPALKQR